MDDETLLAQFEDASIKLTCWDHRAHVKVGYLLIQRDGLVDATARMCKGLRHFLEVKGIATGPEQGFHETLSVGWLELIACAMAQAGPFPNADAFVDKQAHMLNKFALLFFYSRERIMSSEARYRLVPPDLTPFPVPLAPNAGCHQTPRKQAARAFAAEAHAGQRYGDWPYTLHLDAVADILAPFGEEAVVLGYLHDILEDTKVDRAALAAAFGDDVARHIGHLTDIPNAPRKERKQHSHEVLASIDEDGPDAIALLVKAADRLANMRQCTRMQNNNLLAMYKREFPAFQKSTHRLPSGDDLHSKVRARWIDNLWQELSALAAPKND